MTRNASLPSHDSFDYIVVGGGSAGCLLANRLSRDPAMRVLLLEAGRKDDYPWIHIPVGYLYCIGNPRTDWLYKTEPDAGLNGRSLRYPRGKTLGGCSSINGMIYMRGQARDFDGWAAETGDAAWNWQNCLPDFKAHEDHYRLDGGADPKTGGNSHFSDMHGHGGEWRIEKQRLKWDILESFAEAAVEAGIPRSDDFNSGDNEGVGYFEVNQRSGWRWNTSKAFAPGEEPPKPDNLDPIPCRTADPGNRRFRPQALRWSHGPAAGAVGRGSGAPGGHPIRRCNRFAANPAAVRYRSGRIAEASWHRG